MTFKDIIPLLKPGSEEAAIKAIDSARIARSNPWVLKILFFFGALLASGFLMGFLGTLMFVAKESAFIVYAVIFMVGAFALYNFSNGDGAEYIFKEQLALVFMFIGKACFITWVMFTFSSLNFIEVFFSAALALTVCTYPFFRNSADRFISSLVTISCIYIMASGFWSRGFFGWSVSHFWAGINPEYVLSLSYALAAYIFYTRKQGLYPLAYALIAAMAVVGNMSITSYISFKSSGVLGHADMLGGVFFNIPKLIIMAALCGLALYHLRLTKGLNKNTIYVAVAFALMLLFNIPSLMGLGLVVLGYNFSDRKLLWLGYAMFAGGLSYFYYSLDTTLLVKSYVLGAGGLVLLGAAWFTVRGGLEHAE